jgi:hypothetical protein
MAVSRAQLEELVRELPESEITAAYEAVERLMARDRAATRDRRNQKLLDAGLLVHVATGMTSAEYNRCKPVEIRGEPLSATVIRDRR